MGNDKDHLSLARDHAQVLHELRRHDAVKARIRLIENEQGRGSDEFRTDGKPLLLAAGQLRDKLLVSSGQAEGLEDRADPLLLLLVAHILGKAHVGGIFHRRVDRILLAQQVLLRHKADAVLHHPVILVEVDVAFFDGGLRLLVPGHGIDKCALARA